MGVLSTLFREEVKKTKDITQISEMTYSVSYPTGFLNLDVANGYIQETPKGLHYELGISDGSINMLISQSGVGKTTIAAQMALNIIKPFPKSCVFFEEAEVGTNIERIRRLSGLPIDEFKKRFIVRDIGVTTESLYYRVKMVYDIKMQHYNEFSYDTGLVDENGPVIKLMPTVFIFDSVKMIMPGSIAEDQATNMAGAQTAKANADLYTRLVPMCRAANIIIISINHITVDVNTGITPKKADLPYLRQGEKISGGRTLAYLQNNIFRLDIKTKLKKEEGMGIDGSIVDIDIVKSRTNNSGRSMCSLVFDQSSGYDSDLSLFIYLKNNNLLEGSGAFLKLPGCDIKFSQKKFKELLYTNQDFYIAFNTLCINTLRNSLLVDYNRAKEEEALRANSSIIPPYQAILNGLYNAA